MSASEKLRALGAPADDPFWMQEEPSGWVINIILALPQIVALVEAAEQIARSDYRSGQVYATKTDQDMLDAALAALEKALS